MKSDIVLLHGALGSSRQFSQLKELLSSDFNVHVVNFEGHGGVSTHRDYSIELFSNNLQAYLESKKLNNVNIFGYSMGGYVALSLASSGFPLGKIMTLGTKFNWTPEGALAESKMLDPEVIEEKVPKYAQFQKKLHEPLDWKEVMKNTRSMMLRLGDQPVLTKNQFLNIKQDVLCTIGESDNMVTQKETINVVDVLPKGSMYIFPDFQHPLEKIDLAQLVDKINNYFKH